MTEKPNPVDYIDDSGQEAHGAGTDKYLDALDKYILALETKLKEQDFLLANIPEKGKELFKENERLKEDKNWLIENVQMFLDMEIVNQSFFNFVKWNQLKDQS